MKLSLNLLAPRFPRSQTKEVQQLQTYLGEMWQKLQTLVEDINNASAQNAAQIPASTPVDTESIVKAAILRAYPVGSYYYSANATNPGNLFGGTWERIEGRFLFAADSDHAAGSTGGASLHSHPLSEKGGANIRKIGSYFYQGDLSSENMSNNVWRTNANNDSETTYNGPGIGLYGNTDSVETLPPYLACYIFKRTA